MMDEVRVGYLIKITQQYLEWYIQQTDHSSALNEGDVCIVTGVGGGVYFKERNSNTPTHGTAPYLIASGMRTAYLED